MNCPDMCVSSLVFASLAKMRRLVATRVASGSAIHLTIFGNACMTKAVTLKNERVR